MMDDLMDCRTRNSKRKNDLTFGTWNIRTMMQAGKMEEIALELSKLKFDIVVLQELRWKGEGIIQKKDFILYYSGTPERSGQKGIGFWVSKRMKEKVLGFEPVNGRISKLRIKVKYSNLSLVCVYAPIEDNEDETELFYHMLERVCDRVNRYDTLIVLGDFNAKVGKESFIKTVAGSYSLHNETSPNGMKLCQLAENNALKIVSTAYQHKDIHKDTWKTPGGEITNQIDHVLVNARRRSSVLDIRSYRGANCDSDHYLVRIKVRQKISSSENAKGSKRQKWNTQKLREEEETMEEYQEKISDQLKEANNSENIQDKWENIKSAILVASSQIIGKKQYRRNESWFDQECRSYQVEEDRSYHVEGDRSHK